MGGQNGEKELADVFFEMVCTMSLQVMYLS